MFRRAGVSQTLLACGAEGLPLDALTAARLARDGEKAGADPSHVLGPARGVAAPARKLNGWEPEDYWQPEPPVAGGLPRGGRPRVRRQGRTRCVTAIDGCGVETYAFPLREVAAAYAMLPTRRRSRPTDPRAELAPSLVTIRDAMLAEPGDGRRAATTASTRR